MVLGKPASAGFFSSAEKLSIFLGVRLCGEGIYRNATQVRSHTVGMLMVNGLHQSACMSSVYASTTQLLWIHQLSRRMHSGSRMIDHRPGWLLTGCRNGLEKPA